VQECWISRILLRSTTMYIFEKGCPASASIDAYGSSLKMTKGKL
jgi:hypothetical protein